MLSPSPIGRAPHPIARLVAAATLAIFLLAQPWAVCLPLCLAGAHYPVTASAAHERAHAEPCHSDAVVRSDLLASQPLGTMLPTRWVPAILSIRVVALEMASPAGPHLRPLPSTDPPPPRLV